MSIWSTLWGKRRGSIERGIRKRDIEEVERRGDGEQEMKREEKEVERRGTKTHEDMRSSRCVVNVLYKICCV